MCLSTHEHKNTNIKIEEDGQQLDVFINKAINNNKYHYKMSSVDQLCSMFDGVLSLNDISEKIKEDLHQAWIKSIPLQQELPYTEFEFAHYFTKVADIIEDNELNTKGQKSKNTVIKFVSSVEKTKWIAKVEWVYFLTINGRIVKIGGTRTGLSGRASSYLCGHHTPQRGKSGKCSITNAFVYNTLDFYVRNKFKIEMFGFEIPKEIVDVSIFGERKLVRAQVYHAYEAKCLEQYKKQTGKYPSLSDNADPDYKD